jgi:hypothetical protein
MFERNILLPSSGLKSKPSRQPSRTLWNQPLRSVQQAKGAITGELSIDIDLKRKKVTSCVPEKGFTYKPVKNCPYKSVKNYSYTL